MTFLAPARPYEDPTGIGGMCTQGTPLYDEGIDSDPKTLDLVAQTDSLRYCRQAIGLPVPNKPFPINYIQSTALAAHG